MTLTSRLATEDDVPDLVPLITAAIDELQQGFLGEDQIRASHQIMGVDHQLIDDKTYYVWKTTARSSDAVAGAGGRRSTERTTAPAGAAGCSTHAPSRRAFAPYTHPSFTRRGVGRLILRVCADAAAAEGFTRLSLMATLAGLPLYTAAGFTPVEEVADSIAGVPIPLVRMAKDI